MKVLSALHFDVMIKDCDLLRYKNNEHNIKRTGDRITQNNTLFNF